MTNMNIFTDDTYSDISTYFNIWKHRNITWKTVAKYHAKHLDNLLYICVCIYACLLVFHFSRGLTF